MAMAISFGYFADFDKQQPLYNGHLNRFFPLDMKL